MSDYEIVPVTFETANRFVAMFHRHNKKELSARLYIGLMKGDELIGVAIAGRPKARMLDNGRTIEITRVCVKEGHPNANSQLYGRIKKIAMLMGYKRVITYTLRREAQSSLLAVGAVATPVNPSGPKGWQRGLPHRGNHKAAIYQEPKYRWDLIGMDDRI